MRKLRPVPLGRSAVLAILPPALVPMLPVLAIQIPLRELLLKIVSTLV